jgi:hypothetical protein
MTDLVTCTYSVNATTQQAPSGTIKLTDCTPSIANTETMSSWDVIAIVAVLVVVGLLGQYVLHHINKKALKAVWQSSPAQ